MISKTFTDYAAAIEFLAEYVGDASKAINFQRGVGGFTVEVIDLKAYTDYNGKSQTEEVWITADGKMLQVQDMTEDHVRNALRMVLRQSRAAREKYVNDILADMIDDIAGDVEFDDSNEEVNWIKEQLSNAGFDIEENTTENQNDVVGEFEIEPNGKQFVVKGPSTLQ